MSAKIARNDAEQRAAIAGLDKSVEYYKGLSGKRLEREKAGSRTVVVKREAGWRGLPKSKYKSVK